MADEKLTQKTENSSPALTDRMEIVDDPTGTPLSQWISYNNVINSALITVLGTITSGNADAAVSAASTTTAGKSEFATAAEINTGTDATRSMSVDEFVASAFGKRSAILQPISDSAAHVVGDGKQYFPTPEYLNGWNLTLVRIYVVTAGTVSGLFSVMIHNLTQAADMCSTVFSVDPTELTSDTAATPGVINTAEDDITTGDVLRIDFDAVHGTVGQGCYLELVFQLP